MSTFKCKMCGGEIEFEQGATVGVCDSCGTTQTLPRLDNDRKANLYDRANHFRRNNDFDKAMGIYEQILNEDGTDAETYWSLVLCRYGIEYVEDPATHKRVPTVNRAQYTSIFDDDDYKSALKYADGYQRSIYEEEAKAINEIQKGILEISQKEEPFDVFICYKETDSSGRRTPDSVLANDLYHQLTQEGFKVFFSGITLEDKLGTEYEPYIFAALNSAKVMLVVGTDYENFDAVWVKNEWSRFLKLIAKGEKKTLIPVFKNMDAYDMPKEFLKLSAQDMGKVGAMQDLVRGVEKILGRKKAEPEQAQPVQQPVYVSGGPNVTAMIERGHQALEDGEWAKADEFFDQALNMDATPKVIISASGMCEAGRVRHHLKHNLWRKESTILFVGYQAEGTLGRTLLDGSASSVKLFGEDVAVNAEIAFMPGKSGHADQGMLLHWLECFETKPRCVFVNHGEDQVTDIFANLVKDKLGIAANAPYSGAMFDLMTGQYEYEPAGVPVVKETVSQSAARKASLYDKLVAAGKRLTAIIIKSKGMSNKNVIKFTDQINQLCDKWQ